MSIMAARSRTQPAGGVRSWLLGVRVPCHVTTQTRSEEKKPAS